MTMTITSGVDHALVGRISTELKARPRQNLVGGRWVDSEGGKRFATHNPATGEVLAELPRSTAADVDRAVQAARAAFADGSEWRRMPPADRAKLIWRVGELIEARHEELAVLESLDNGKPITASRSYDVPTAWDHFYYMAGWATKIEGASVMNMSPVYLPGSRYHAFTRREPIGVCGQITPWNFPLQMAAWKIAPALAAGCTVILKPAEQTPLTATRLVELCQEAGIPDGVVNLVHGLGEEAGAAMAAHRGIDKIAFTGSTQVGKLLAKASGDSNLKRLTLELGGKSPQVVLADADVPAAIAGTATAVFYNHGQMCTSGSRIFIHRRIYSDVLDGILDHARGLKIGPGLEPDSTMGPLVSKEQYERVTGYIRSGLSEGATAATGGLPSAALGGFFVEPTVLVDTTAEMTVQREEIFGPVALPIPFDDEDEIVAMANDTTFGLAAGIWSKDVAKALRVAERIQAGKVWINCYNVFDSSLPFGGYKESGWGRECSKEALGNYLETKSVVVAL